jgi:hypothetical protein
MSGVILKVAGVNFHLVEFKQAEVKPGDAVALMPDPTNAYDPNAIKVVKRGLHIGFIPRGWTADVREALEDGFIVVVESCTARGCAIRFVAPEDTI